METKTFTLKLDSQDYDTAKKLEKVSDFKMSEFFRKQLKIYISVANARSRMILDKMSVCFECGTKHKIEDMKFQEEVNENETQIWKSFCPKCCLNKESLVGVNETDEESFQPDGEVLDYGLMSVIEFIDKNELRLLKLENGLLELEEPESHLKKL